MRIHESIDRNGPFLSLEFFPPKEKEKWPQFFKVVEQLKQLSPLFASVTYGAGGSTSKNTLAIASKIRNHYGIETMPHLTCVGSKRKDITTFLNACTDAGIENILALRGDYPEGKSYDPNTMDFRYAEDLVRFIKGTHPGMTVAVAGYPGAHPESSSIRNDIMFLKNKIDAGSEFVVTQLFFDNRYYFDMVERLRAMGVTAPIIPGVLPIQSLQSVRRILSLSGASIPGDLYLELEAAQEKGGAAAVREMGIAFAARQIRELLNGGAPGVHLYTLNKADMCLDIWNRVQAG